MFTKLLKHEWRATRGTLGVLSLAALGAGLLGALVLRILFNGQTMVYVADDWTYVALSIVLMFLFLGLVVYAIGAEFFLLYRFYKNKFTDEGYLTFTLPVSSREIFLASFLNMFLWMLIITIVVIAAFCMMFIGGMSGAGIDLTEEFGIVSSDLSAMMGEVDIGYILLSLLSGLLSFVSGIVVMMTCVTLGAVIARKHKILGAFGVYYVLTMVQNLLSTVFSAIALTGADTEKALYTSLFFQIDISILLAVGGFLLSTWLMEKKLNLP